MASVPVAVVTTILILEALVIQPLRDDLMRQDKTIAESTHKLESTPTRDSLSAGLATLRRELDASRREVSEKNVLISNLSSKLKTQTTLPIEKQQDMDRESKAQGEAIQKPSNQNDSKREEPQPMVVASAEENDFIFSLQRCERSGGTVHCSGTIANKSPRRRKFRMTNETYVVDDSGNQYPYDYGTVILGAYYAGTISDMGQELEPDVPIKFTVSAKETDPSMLRLTLIIAYQTWEGSGITTRGKVVLKCNSISSR
jgi:hypothetical protein